MSSVEEGERQWAASVPWDHLPRAQARCARAGSQRDVPRCSRTRGGAQCRSVGMGTRGRGCKAARLKADTGFCPVFLQVFPVDVGYAFLQQLFPPVEQSCLLTTVTVTCPDETGCPVPQFSLWGLQIRCRG